MGDGESETQRGITPASVLKFAFCRLPYGSPEPGEVGDSQSLSEVTRPSITLRLT